MSGSVEFEFAAALNSVFYACAKYVLDNKDKLSDTTEDELVSAFATATKTPRTPNTVTPPLTGIIPGFGTIQATAPKTAVKRTKAVKDAPVQEWIEFDDYKTRKDEGQKICAYFSEKGTQKNKVCAAKCEDVDTTEKPDPLDWRCVTCKDKAGTIKKKFEKAAKQTTPTRVVTGVNIPQVPLPPRPSMLGGPLPSMPPIFGNLSVPTPSGMVIPSTPSVGLNPPVPMTPSLPIPKLSSPKKLPPVVPEPSEPEEESEVKEEEPPAKIEWLAVAGLENYFTTNYPGFKKVLFKLDRANQRMYAVGRVNGEVDTDAATKLVQLNDKETNFVANIMKSSYTFEGSMMATLPSIPSIPGLPGL